MILRPNRLFTLRTVIVRSGLVCPNIRCGNKYLLAQALEADKM